MATWWRCAAEGNSGIDLLHIMLASTQARHGGEWSAHSHRTTHQTTRSATQRTATQIRQRLEGELGLSQRLASFDVDAMVQGQWGSASPICI